MVKSARMNVFNRLLSFLLISSLCATLSTAQQRYCGIALSTGHDTQGYYAGKTTKTLMQIKNDGANFVQISAYARQYGKNANKHIPETDDEALKYIIRKAKKRNLRVFLKPVIEPRTRVGGPLLWRGFIPGTYRWFNNVHLPFMLRMARLAQAENVDVLSVGSEYVATLSNTKMWLHTIKRVREVYDGKLTYIANHDAYQRVRFFHKLDFISISAYFRLRYTSRGPYPNLQGTKKLYASEMRKLVAWRKRMKLGDKKVLIAEFGIQSKGAGINYYIPWDWTVKGPLSLSDQMKMYEGFLSTFVSKPWSLGIMLWHYELDPNAGKPGTSQRKGYTPQNKPARNVLRKYFKGLC